MCLLRWSERMKALRHISQRKFFSPVWIRMCLWSSSERVNFLLQIGNLQTNGFSPVCHLKWAFKCDVLPYSLPQPAWWQTWSNFLPAVSLPALSSVAQLGQSQLARPA